MNRSYLTTLMRALLESPLAHVLVQLPNGEMALIQGVASNHGELIIMTTMDAQQELK